MQGAPGTAAGRARDGTSASINMVREPGTGDGKPGTRDGAVQCTCVHAGLLNKFTLVIVYYYTGNASSHSNPRQHD